MPSTWPRIFLAVIAGPSGSIVVSLPLTAALATAADGASWLPGRQYSWVTGSSPPGAALVFYNKNISTGAGWDYAATTTIPGLTASAILGVSGPAVSNLIVTLKNSQGVLATYKAPAFQAISESPIVTKWKFAFAFRLKQPGTLDTDRTWLQTVDPRASFGPAGLSVYDNNEGASPNPNFFLNNSPVSSQYLSQYLLYRTQGKSVVSDAAYNDVPLFELPRLPFLSLGELQHLQVAGTPRPFALGNSWGATMNGAFDRFFFSGLPVTGAHPTLALREPLPNWNLLPVDRPGLRRRPH